jgi:hypothetical protein
MLKHSLNAKTRSKKGNVILKDWCVLSAPIIWSPQHSFGQTITGSAAPLLSDKN